MTLLARAGPARCREVPGERLTAHGQTVRNCTQRIAQCSDKASRRLTDICGAAAKFQCPLLGTRRRSIAIAQCHASAIGPPRQRPGAQDPAGRRPRRSCSLPAAAASAYCYAAISRACCRPVRSAAASAHNPESAAQADAAGESAAACCPVSRRHARRRVTACSASSTTTASTYAADAVSTPQNEVADSRGEILA